MTLIRQFSLFIVKWLIVINEIHQLSQKKLDFSKFRNYGKPYG